MDKKRMGPKPTAMAFQHHKAGQLVRKDAKVEQEKGKDLRAKKSNRA